MMRCCYCCGRTTGYGPSSLVLVAWDSSRSTSLEEKRVCAVKQQVLIGIAFCDDGKAALQKKKGMLEEEVHQELRMGSVLCEL